MSSATRKRKHTHLNLKLYRTECDHQSHLQNETKCKKSQPSGDWVADWRHLKLLCWDRNVRATDSVGWLTTLGNVQSQHFSHHNVHRLCVWTRLSGRIRFRSAHTVTHSVLVPGLQPSCRLIVFPLLPWWCHPFSHNSFHSWTLSSHNSSHLSYWVPWIAQSTLISTLWTSESLLFGLLSRLSNDKTCL